jgi:hypothetical protein
MVAVIGADRRRIAGGCTAPMTRADEIPLRF